jgi:hypothetical protein
MNEPLLLPGDGVGSTPSSSQFRNGSSGLLRVVVAVWLLTGLAFLGVKFLSGKRDPAPVVAATGASATAISSEDLLDHLQALDTTLAAASARMRRAEDQIQRTVPVIERNYLLVEKQHLESAIALTDAARLDLEQGRKTAALVLNSLKKEHNQ